MSPISQNIHVFSSVPVNEIYSGYCPCMNGIHSKVNKRDPSPKLVQMLDLLEGRNIQKRRNNSEFGWD